MKVNAVAIAKAIILLVVLTVLPIVGRPWIPEEAFRFLTIQGGVDLTVILDRVALIGATVSVLVLLTGHMKKASRGHLVVSVVWKVFWLFILLFLLGLGYPETFGLATLGGKSGSAVNIVVFDLRFFANLVTVIAVLMIIRLILQFQENHLEICARAKYSDKVTKNE